jgi:thymidylate synthase (FAD)
MGKIILLPETTKNPITLIGQRAGICWGADVSDQKKNYNRGLDCLRSNHGRTFEYVNIEFVIEGYSARVIRELYTHIGGAPTRLQESTRYVDCSNFQYVIPDTIKRNEEALAVYNQTMQYIKDGYTKLMELNIPKEDSAMVMPLGMESKVVYKGNLRTLIDMSRQRMCTRAYWEYRNIMFDLCDTLSEYSEEWNRLVRNEFAPKCEVLGYCPEKDSCGRYLRKGES